MKVYIRLILLVGLPVRLEDNDALDTLKSKGTPSRMSSCFAPRPFTGRGICDSGPLAEYAESASQEVRRCILVPAVDGGGRATSALVGDHDVGGSGRGPRSKIVSRVLNWACFCLISCFSALI